MCVCLCVCQSVTERCAAALHLGALWTPLPPLPPSPVLPIHPHTPSSASRSPAQASHTSLLRPPPPPLPLTPPPPPPPATVSAILRCLTGFTPLCSHWSSLSVFQRRGCTRDCAIDTHFTVCLWKVSLSLSLSPSLSLSSSRAALW